MDIVTTVSCFSIKQANPYEKEQIMGIMKQEVRQTMNLRLMPSAELLLLLDDNKNKQIIGWIGLDYQYNPKFPETFSLFVKPEYRSMHLSVILKYAAYSKLYAKGICKSYSRMEGSHNQTLIDCNLNSGCYRILSSEEVNPQWKSMCLHCELYGKNCALQVYLEVNVSCLMNLLKTKLEKLFIRNSQSSWQIKEFHHA